MALPDPARSRAVLIGVAKYNHLAPLPAVGSNLAALRRVLIDPGILGLPEENVRTIEDPATPVELIKPIEQAARQATDLLFIYYAGHGMVDPEDETFLLALPGSEHGAPYSAVQYEHLRRVLAQARVRCRAKVRLVVLDCCYSGRALSGQMGDDDSYDLVGSFNEEVGRQADIEGSCVVASTSESGLSLAPIGAEYTLFSGQLLRTLENGSALSPNRNLTINDVFRDVKQSLLDLSSDDETLPIPTMRSDDVVSSAELVRNRSVQVVTPAVPLTAPGLRQMPPPVWDPEAPVDMAAATDFLQRLHAENPRLGPCEPRLALVRAQVAATGSYVHTQDELIYGAKLAWRNSSRCIGRLYWRSLVVLDRRRARSADEIFSLLVHHLQVASGGTQGPGAAIRPVLSVFAPGKSGYPSVKNRELVQYAGYRRPDSSIVGDRRNTELTDLATKFGWPGGGGTDFDVLPLVVETPGAGLRLYELPERAIQDVPISHPEHAFFADLGLRWVIAPAVADMRLTIGGVHYPFAVFSRWYVDSEVAARLADALPRIAHELKLDTSRESTLWRAQAMLELRRAVLWSFEQAGVKMSDHHTEGSRYFAHCKNEARAGRDVPTDWAWMAPYDASPLQDLARQRYAEPLPDPNFWLRQS